MCKNRVIYGFLNTSWVLINMAPRNRGQATWNLETTNTYVLRIVALLPEIGVTICQLEDVSSVSTLFLYATNADSTTLAPQDTQVCVV